MLLLQDSTPDAIIVQSSAPQSTIIIHQIQEDHLGPSLYRESDLFIYTEVPLLYIHINIHTYSWNLCDGNTKITLSKPISLQTVYYGALQERFSNEELFSSYFHTFKALSSTSIHLFSILENCCTFISRVVHSRRKLRR